MKIAIMQPYIFPYIGYFQLIRAVDVFVFYDDVNYIKQGWINRNNILVSGRSSLFTIPLQKPSSFMKINEVKINDKMWEQWKKKFLRTLEQNYRKAPYYEEGYTLIENILFSYTKGMTISKLAIKCVVEISNYLNIDTKIISSSTIYGNDNLSGKERVIDICKIEKANHYINAIGGKELYDKDYFESHNIRLNFLEPKIKQYEQFGKDFVPFLSIIDALMFDDKYRIKENLNKYQLV